MPEVTDPAILEQLNGGPRGAPQPVLSRPNVDQAADNARADAGAQNDEIRTGLAVSGDQRSSQNSAFDHMTTLANRYSGLPEVKSYKVAVGQLAQALGTGQGAQADLALTYAFAKAMDPDSVVRDAEQGMQIESQPWFQAKVEQVRKQFGADDAGVFSDEARAALRRQIINSVSQRAKTYNLRRSEIEQIARANGIDPAQVIGRHDGEPFLEQFRQYDQAQGGGDQAVAGQGESTPSPYAGYFDENGNPLGPDGGGAYDAQGNYLGLVGGVTDTSPDKAQEEYNARLDARLAQEREKFGDAAPGFIDLAKHGMSGTLSDEASGIGGAIYAGMTGGDIGQGFRFERDLERRRIEQARERTGALGTGLEMLAGGAAFGTNVPSTLAGLWRDSAIAGGITGFGSGEGARDSLMGAAIGGTAGAALGSVAQRFAARNAAKVAVPSESAQAYSQGQKFGLDLSLGDAGGRGAKMVERTLDTQPAAANAMNANRARLGAQLQTAVDDVAGGFGPTTSFREMGAAAQAGVKNWRARFDTATEKAYNAIKVHPQAPADLTNTVGALEELTNKITSNPKLGEMLTDKRLVGYLEALRGKVSKVSTGVLDAQGNPITREITEGGSLSWNDLKQLRSRIGEEIGDQILGEGTLKSDLRHLYGSLSDDMRATAEKQGPAALRSFDRANTLYREGQERLERVWTSLLGKDGERTPEAAASFIQRMTRDGKSTSDIAQLAELRRTLKPDEWAQVSNGLIRLMGQVGNAESRSFTPSTFVTSFDNLAPEAKNVLFGGAGKPLRQNLEEFTDVVRRIAANDGTRNVSGTAYGVGALVSQGAGAGVGMSIAGPYLGPILGIAASHGAAYNMANLWTNPQFVRWATGYAKMVAGASRSGNFTQGAVGSQMSALSRIATTQPIIAAEALGLQQQLLQAFETAPMRAAAAPSREGKTNTEGAKQ